MTDNINTIRERFIKRLSEDQSNDHFYILIILHRSKDDSINDPNRSKQHTVLTRYVRTVEEYDNMLPELIYICNATNSRLMIYTNMKSLKELTHEILGNVVDCIKTSNYHKALGVVSSSAVKSKTIGPRYILIDVDNEHDRATLLELLTDPIVIYTPNGCHFLVEHINIPNFRERFPHIVVQRNSCTVVYSPR